MNRCIMCNREIIDCSELCPKCLNIRNNFGEKCPSTMSLFNSSTSLSGIIQYSDYPGVRLTASSAYSTPTPLYTPYNPILSEQAIITETSSSNIVTEVLEQIPEQKNILDQQIYSIIKDDNKIDKSFKKILTNTITWMLFKK